MLLDLNTTKNKACAYKANIFHRIFEQTTVGKNNFSVILQHHCKVSIRVLPLYFTLNVKPIESQIK
jgi:hypothetical protein